MKYLIGVSLTALCVLTPPAPAAEITFSGKVVLDDNAVAGGHPILIYADQPKVAGAPR